MPVMIRRNKHESGSTKNENGILSVSAFIQEKSSIIFDFCAEAFTSIKIKTERTKEARTDAQAIQPDMPLLIFFPKNPLIKKPISGNRGTRPINFIIYCLLL